jgi:hypothetical protein
MNFGGGIIFWVVCGIALLVALFGAPILFIVGFLLGIAFKPLCEGKMLAWL